VNGPEILHLIRHDLQGAVARQPKPPTARPMHVSSWLAMSVFQKAIRRGREDLALRAAATLLRDAPEKLWRRLGCIAFEDIGVASLEAVGLATVALAGKRHRSELGGEWAVASCIISELTRAPKCRAADDLLMVCELHPAHAEARVELPHLTTRDLISITVGKGTFETRALALWYALGTDRRPSALVAGPASHDLSSTTCVKPGGRIRLSRSRAKGSGAVATCCARSSPFCPLNRANQVRYETTISHRRP
jgi:hypothetical protein